VAPARVAVWSDREEPYQRGDAARVYLSARRPGHVAVFRVDTDGRVRTLFPREPWGDTHIRQAREFEVVGRGGRSFIVDDDPGIGYLLAISSEQPFDFRDISRGDHWDYRLIEGGRIRGDPYVALADLAARLTPGGDYDYDVSPYYVGRRYDYPRSVCYDCHAYAKYDEWDPYRRACARFRMVIYDDPRYYPYRTGRGRNIVVARPVRPGPRRRSQRALRDPRDGHRAGRATDGRGREPDKPGRGRTWIGSGAGRLVRPDGSPHGADAARGPLASDARRRAPRGAPANRDPARRRNTQGSRTCPGFSPRRARGEAAPGTQEHR
jgi:hypothetical protein